ncbi:MAG: type IV secretion system protein [Rickettsiales bacterium]|jgi:type IV secretion system protein VirB8|nr:type IV secretion system protein [Rickettsiales bacterium]
MATKQQKLQLKSWYSSKYQIVVIQRNILFFISFFAVVSVLLAIVFVRQIMSSKSLVPYVIELEEKTGVPTVVEQLNQSQFTADATLKRYFVFSFVKSVEGYNPGTFKDDYRKVRLFTTPNVFRQVSKAINPKNEKSPALLIGNRGMIEVALKSISFVNAQKATVRFRLKNVGQVVGFINNRDMIADVEFVFADLKLSAEDRYVNPLGFQVTRYVVDQELVQGYEE